MLDSTKSQDSERIITIDKGTADMLTAWRTQQLKERLAWGAEWTDSGRVFTREDGTPLRPTWISQRFGTLVARAKLPPITLHGLRHGAATMFRRGTADQGHLRDAWAFHKRVHSRRLHRGCRGTRRGIAAFIPRKNKITS